jgi:hypothetical protein
MRWRARAFIRAVRVTVAAHVADGDVVEFRFNV